jgi:hypothetical protein
MDITIVLIRFGRPVTSAGQRNATLLRVAFRASGGFGGLRRPLNFKVAEETKFCPANESRVSLRESFSEEAGAFMPRR